RALAAAHHAGLVHRDVKPENVMVRHDGVIKVLDFGLAKRTVVPVVSATAATEGMPTLTGRGVALGTPHYMAPEQMRAEPLDGRADQFSWGVVAYELLAGARPWGREIDDVTLVSRLLSDEPPPLAARVPDVPGHVAAVVARAMAKARDARFATMDELTAALERTPSAPAATPVEGQARPSSAKPLVRAARWPVIALALALVASFAFVVVALTRGAAPPAVAPKTARRTPL